MMTPMLMTALALALAGPLGYFVVWRRMAYFGDGLAHSALLGVTVDLIAGMSNQIGMILVGFVRRHAALVHTKTAGHGYAARHSRTALSLGVVAMALLGLKMLKCMIICSAASTMSALTVWSMWCWAAVWRLALMRLWPGLLLMTTSEELAHAEGVPVRVYEFLLMLLLGIVVAAAVQTVGILLITSLLIIPASTARLIARQPETMAIGGSVMAALCMLGGLPVAATLNVPLGPAIVTLTVLV